MFTRSDFDIKNKTAEITAETQMKNEYPTAKSVSYEVVIRDTPGKLVKTLNGGRHSLAPGETKTIAAADKLTNLNFWSWGYGYLYTVTTNLKVDGKLVDSVKTRTGFRKTEFANGMFKLNDRTLQIKRLRPTHVERMARSRQFRPAVAVRLQQPSDGRIERQPRPLDAHHAVETGCRIVRPRRPDAGDARRRRRKRCRRPPLGTAKRGDARRDHLQPQQPEHCLLRIRQRKHFANRTCRK